MLTQQTHGVVYMVGICSCIGCEQNGTFMNKSRTVHTEVETIEGHFEPMALSTTTV